MRLTKRIAVLLLLLSCLKFGAEPARADNECTEACANNYDACMADADYNEGICESYAEGHYYQCVQDCNYYYPQWQGCASFCEGAYSEELGNCSGGRASAQSSCGLAYNACFNNCPNP